MSTARKIIEDVTKLLGVWTKGTDLTADEAQDGLRLINLFLDSLSKKRLSLFTTKDLSLALTSGVGSYTIGRGGQFKETSGTAQSGTSNTIVLASGESTLDNIWDNYQILIDGGTGSGQRRTISDWAGDTLTATVSVDWTTTPDATSTYYIESKRPHKITEAFTRDSNNLDSQIEIITSEQYNQFSLKSTTGTYPDFLYYKNSYPQGVIKLLCLPGANLTLHIESLDYLTQLPTLDSEVSFPEGYEMMIIYNVAVLWAPQFQVTPDPIILSTAKSTLADIQKSNIEPFYLKTDLPRFQNSSVRNTDLFPFRS